MLSASKSQREFRCQVVASFALVEDSTNDARKKFCVATKLLEATAQDADGPITLLPDELNEARVFAASLALPLQNSLKHHLFYVEGDTASEVVCAAVCPYSWICCYPCIWRSFIHGAWRHCCLCCHNYADGVKVEDIMMMRSVYRMTDGMLYDR